MGAELLPKSRARLTAVITAVTMLLTLVLVPYIVRASAPHRTHVRIAGGLNATGAGVVQVAAVLADRDDQGAPVAGRMITFALGAQTAAATTDSQGVARAPLTFTAGLAASVTATFGGDAAYNPSVDSALFNAVQLFPQVPALNHSQSKYIALVPNTGGLFGFGGALPTSGFSGGYAPLFLNLDPLRISDASRPDPLSGFDTVVLNGICDIGSSRWLGNATFRSRLQTFTLGGGKLVLYNSECTNTNYSQFFLPFTSNTPGALGATGALQIAEENSLSNSNSSSPYYIDAAKIATQTDAVGDANVMVSYDPNWCVDLLAKNARLPEFKPVHTYALIGQGLVIYNGFDKDHMSSSSLGHPGTGAYYLTRLWELEMKQPWTPSGLPCEQSVAPATIALIPAAAVHDVGQTHTATASVVSGGHPLVGVYLTLQVTGANASSYTATTDATGTATFSYAGATAGTDTLVVRAGAVSSNNATVTWNEAGPCQLVWRTPANGGTPLDVSLGSTATLRFSWGDCHRFIHDESVIINVEQPAMESPPIVTWLYGLDIVIDDAAKEYRVNFTPGRYGLTAGMTLPVTVYMSGAFVGQASVHLTP